MHLDVEIEAAVLIVEDHAPSRVALASIIAAPGVRVLEAGSGEEALQLLLKHHVAVVLIDIHLPGMSGFELAGYIRRRPRTRDIPILFFTGAEEFGYAARAYALGAADYLLKPYLPEVVKAKVAVFVTLYRQQRQIEEQARRLREAERREMELKLSELALASARHYRSLAEAIPQIVWTARADGAVEYLSTRWFEYTGLDAERSFQGWLTACHPGDVEGAERTWREALRTGRPWELSLRLRARDGSYRWHLGRGSPEIGQGGEVVSWVGTFTDIEEQQRAQAALSEFKETLDAVVDAVWIFQAPTWAFQYVNRGATELLGYAREELLETTPLAIMPEFDDSSFAELLAPLVRHEKASLTVETFCRRSDGTDVPIELVVQLAHGDAERFICIARDIRTRRLAERERVRLYRQAKEAVRARDEFLAIASHELKTPLAALRLQVDSLLRMAGRLEEPKDVVEATNAKLHGAARQVARMGRLIDELLDVSRMAGGRLRLEVEPVDLAAIVHDVAGRFAEELARAGCELRILADAPVRGRWDPARIDQVVSNLISNAIKYGAGKPIEVEVAEENGLARLTVRDHGIGIAPENLRRIFQRFERAVSSRHYGGLGLGLYIVRTIVAAHGGRIEASSEPGAGATFTVFLPFEPGAAETPPERVVEVHASPPPSFA